MRLLAYIAALALAVAPVNAAYNEPGGGSGGSLTITDGARTVTPTTNLSITGGTVGGSTPNATLTITAVNTPGFISPTNASGLNTTGLGGVHLALQPSPRHFPLTIPSACQSPYRVQAPAERMRRPYLLL